jgi:CBS domain-containing protein/uncharacterized protein (DUF2267 family)
MSLDHYRRPRLIVLSPDASVRDAARAMADQHVGTVLVGNGDAIVGIVTDRDLCLEVVAGDVDPRAATLGDVMSDGVATIDVGASVAEAARLMRAHVCRRLPITDDGVPVGLVTLDDLLLDGALDPSEARAVLIAQIDAAFPSRSPARQEGLDARARARMRRRARAEATYNRLLHAVERSTGLGSRHRAERALTRVLGAICRRLLPQQASHFIAQLPSKLHGELTDCLDGPDKRISTQSMEAELRRELDLDDDAAAEVLHALCKAVADAISPGEVEAVRSQLPAAMKDLFPPANYRRAG